MHIKNIKNNYYIVKLDETQDLNSFSCGLDDMDDFLKNDAFDQQSKNLMSHTLLSIKTIL